MFFKEHLLSEGKSNLYIILTMKWYIVFTLNMPNFKKHNRENLEFQNNWLITKIFDREFYLNFFLLSANALIQTWSLAA